MIRERKLIPGVDRWYHGKFEIQADTSYKKEQNASRTSVWKAEIQGMKLSKWSLNFLNSFVRNTSGKDVKQAVVVWTGPR